MPPSSGTPLGTTRSLFSCFGFFFLAFFSWNYLLWGELGEPRRVRSPLACTPGLSSLSPVGVSTCFYEVMRSPRGVYDISIKSHLQYNLCFYMVTLPRGSNVLGKKSWIKRRWDANSQPEQVISGNKPETGPLPMRIQGKHTRTSKRMLSWALCSRRQLRTKRKIQVVGVFSLWANS